MTNTAAPSNAERPGGCEDFYRIVIALPTGALATCIVHERALKGSSSTTKKTPATGAAAG